MNLEVRILKELRVRFVEVRILKRLEPKTSVKGVHSAKCEWDSFELAIAIT
jgi:hypothetical protein